VLNPQKLPLQPQKLVEKFLIYLTLLTNLFICSGVIRHWNNMPHQNSTMRAGACPYAMEPEKKSDKETKEKLEAQYKEPEGDPSF